jgi:hypothetical protein
MEKLNEIEKDKEDIEDYKKYVRAHYSLYFVVFVTWSCTTPQISCKRDVMQSVTAKVLDLDVTLRYWTQGPPRRPRPARLETRTDFQTCW